MLKKLLKYDLRANLKIFVFLWPAILLFAIMARFIFQADRDDSFLLFLIQGSTFVTFAVVLIAALAFSYIFSTVRFYAGLLGKEGYLMHTLPVKPWQLVLSKFLAALAYTGATAILCIFAVLLQFLGREGLWETIKNLLPDGTVWAFTIAIAVMSLCTNILQIYCAASLGHLFRKKRLFWSILIWYGLTVVMRVMQFVFLLSEGFFLEFMDSFDTLVDVSFVVVLLAQSGLCAAYFFGSERVLSKRLNLE